MATRQVKSVCPYCGVGCGIILETDGQRVIKLTGDKEHPANFGRLCTKGSTAASAITAPDRMDSAYSRPARGAAPLRVKSDAAIRETASRLRAILDEHGPDALSFYVSGQMSLEAQYLINKLAKGFIRTRHIESNSRLCMASAGTGYKLSLGADGPPGSYQDIDKTDLFFVIGSNMADCHPILFLRLMDRVKAGAKLVVVDPRRTATADKAHLFMQIKPGTDLALLNGLLHLLLKNGHTDSDFIARYTTGFEGFPDFLEDYSPGKVSEITGIPEKDIHQTAEWIGKSGSWMTLWTMGLNQSTHGTWHTNAICNLHLATGAICRPGSGPFSLTGQPNAMGGREMGYMGPGLPGQRSLLSDEDRRFTEELWKIPSGSIRAEAGGGTVSMFEELKNGEIKACWIICTNPVATVPNREQVIEGLKAAELVITQDVFLDTETNRYADIMLPGALWAEAEGIMINSERNLTLMGRAVEPPGEAMPDWDIIARVACEMGYAEAFTFRSAGEVYEELQQAYNPATGYDLRGASYERLKETSMQWPCGPDASSDRNPIRYVRNSNEITFPTKDGRAVFWARPYLPPAELPDTEYPFVLNSGRLQHQWHTLTKTGKIEKLNKLNPGPFVEIHPDDASALDISEGDLVVITSRRGTVSLPAVLTDRVRPGGCFAPLHWNDVFGDQLAVNAVTSDAVDPSSLQPELKYCAVSLAKSAASKSEATQNQLPNPTLSNSILTYDKKEAVTVMAQLEVLEQILGIKPSKPMALEPHEQAYLSGFLTSLRSTVKTEDSGIPVLPSAAPMEPDKRHWVDGLLAGMFSRISPSGSETASFLASNSDLLYRIPVTILWASQTGNAENAAVDCAKKLGDYGFGVRLVNMSDYPASDLTNESHVLFIASTFGAGDPPDNGARFYQELMAYQAPALAHLRYAVLAFGDSSYDIFCGFGRNLDDRLSSLGAKRMLETELCDSDYEERIGAWMNAVTGTLAEWSSGQDNSHRSVADANETATARTATARTATAVAEALPSFPASDTGYSRNRPVRTSMLFNRLLSREGSAKETRHYAFDLAGTGLQYDTGDALGIWPVNSQELAGELLDVLHLDPSEPVEVKNYGKMALLEALIGHFEIARIPIELLHFVTEQTNHAMLRDLQKNENKSNLREWLWGRQLVDVLREYPVSLTAAGLIQLLKPLQPRLYSISSSPKACPDEVHITVSTVRYSYNGCMRNGVCSTYLADLAAEDADIRIFIQRNANFRPPSDPDAPMIMVGPGTGIAPFRGFLQDRRASGAKGKNWLFFGEQHEALDYYFKDELEHFAKEGYLHRLDTAFSRDQNEKVYVQHRMLEHGAELWSWLQEGGHFYVCGDASRMAKEVDAALRTVIRRYGGLNEDEASTFIQEMLRQKRYQKDVY